MIQNIQTKTELIKWNTRKYSNNSREGNKEKIVGQGIKEQRENKCLN